VSLGPPVPHGTQRAVSKGGDHRVGPLPALRPVSALGESTSYASRKGGREGFDQQEVAAHTRQGQGLLLLRQKMTGDTPSRWAGCDSAGTSRLRPPRWQEQPMSHPQRGPPGALRVALKISHTAGTGNSSRCTRYPESAKSWGS